MSSAWDGLLNVKEVTELPHYAINQSAPEDSFFTDHEVAAYCFEKFEAVARSEGVNLLRYTFVEPSAGEGCFFRLLPAGRRKALDIQPRHPQVARGDFLRWWPKSKGKFVVIGNPPFGVRGAYALAFVNRAFLFADMVGFILPMSFYSNGKGSNMKRVANATLVHSEKLPSQSFYMPHDKKPVSVNTVFQVWKKGQSKSAFNDYDVSEYVDIFTVCSSPDRRCGMDKLDVYDCYVSSTFYADTKTVSTFDEVNYGSGYGIVIKSNRRKVLRVLRQANWLDYCSDATNHCKHLRMYSIRKCLGEAGLGRAV